MRASAVACGAREVQRIIGGGRHVIAELGRFLPDCEAAATAHQIPADRSAGETHLAFASEAATEEHVARDHGTVTDERETAGVLKHALVAIKLPADLSAEETHLALSGEAIAEEHIAGDPGASAVERETVRVPERALDATELSADPGAGEEEAAGMMWEELDLERGIWRLPSAEEYQPARTKNGEEHIVDLSPQAAAILAALPGERRGLVFTTTGTTPVSGFSKVKDRLDALMAGELQRELNQPDYKLRPWRTHDLRRTAATLMGEQLDVSQGVVERILNHVSGTQGGLMGIYQRQQYREKRRNALLAWGVFIAQLTGDLPAADHIVTLAGRR